MLDPLRCRGKEQAAKPTPWLGASSSHSIMSGKLEFLNTQASWTPPDHPWLNWPQRSTTMKDNREEAIPVDVI